MTKLFLPLFFVCSLLFSSLLVAGEKEGVKMPDSIKVGETALVLNGMTLRKAKKFGVEVKVYIGGLYLSAKESVADKIMATKGVKRVVMHFIFFRVPKKRIKNGWKKSYKEFCADKCKENKKHLKVFLKQIKTMTKGDIITLDFFPDKLSMGVKKKKKTTNVDIPSGDFANIILQAFVKAKNKEFQSGLLGL